MMPRLKTILMLLQTDYPPDVRLKKEIKSLLASGYFVVLLANNSMQRDRKEIVEGCVVHRLAGFRFLPPFFGRVLRLPYILNLLWFWHAVKIVRTYNVDAVHAHDLPMAPFGLILSKMFNIPFIYDMHENYPAAMAEWNENAGIIQKITRNEKTALALDLFCAKRAHRIIVVVKEMFDLLRQRHIAPEKIYIVSNTVDLDVFETAIMDKVIIEKYKDSFTILYLGAFSVERGLGTAIKAMSAISKDIPNAILLLVGDGKNRIELEEYAKKEKVDHLVEFSGWVDFKKVPSFMKASRICIVPQPSGPFIDTTIPHKIFQYMAVGKPVVTSDAGPLRRVVEESKCGEFFKSNDPQDFAQAVLKIFTSKTNYAENGRRAVQEKYNWNYTARNLTRLYESL